MYGHESGDQMLIAVANAIRAEAIKKRISHLASLSTLESGAVSLAVGYAIKEKTSTDIKEVMKEADNEMYKDKVIQKSKGLQEA